MLCCKYRSSRFDLIFLNLIPIIDFLFKKTIFHFLGLGVSGWGIWFFYGGPMGVLAYGG